MIRKTPVAGRVPNPARDLVPGRVSGLVSGLGFFLSCAAASGALAHPAEVHAEMHQAGLAAGIAHPLTGVDHMLAALAVGLFAARRGERAIWSAPVAFIAAIAGGFALSLFTLTMPMLEATIAASVLVIAAMAVAADRVRITPALGLIALFGLFHGYAHGVEATPGELGPFAFGAIAAMTGLVAASAAACRLLIKNAALRGGAAS